MGKIYLIRHGETEANKTFQFQGSVSGCSIGTAL